MQRVHSLLTCERPSPLFGAVFGSLLVLLTWIGTEATLRVVNDYPFLSFSELLSYAYSGAISGAILSATAIHARNLARAGQVQKARYLCVITGAVVAFGYIGIEVWHGLQMQHMTVGLSMGGIVNEVTPSMWVFQIINLFVSQNLPFLLSLLMLLIGFLWSAPNKRHH